MLRISKYICKSRYNEVSNFCTVKPFLSSKCFIRMANLKACRTSTSDYSYTEFYAIFAQLFLFVPKDTVSGGQFR